MVKKNSTFRKKTILKLERLNDWKHSFSKKKMKTVTSASSLNFLCRKLKTEWEASNGCGVYN